MTKATIKSSKGAWIRIQFVGPALNISNDIEHFLVLKSISLILYFGSSYDPVRWMSGWVKWDLKGALEHDVDHSH